MFDEKLDFILFPSDVLFSWFPFGFLSTTSVRLIRDIRPASQICKTFFKFFLQRATPCP
jgi:hypothetical protein